MTTTRPTTHPGSRSLTGASVLLPTAKGALERLVLREPARIVSALQGSSPPSSRICYAAPHVVADPRSGGDASVDAIDWETTLAFRTHLWDQGLGVAEAMDTAQRGMGLSWEQAKRLISLTAEMAAGRRLCAGAATDQLDEHAAHSLDEIAAAYVEQCQFIEGVGAIPVVMASRALAAAATSPQDYLHVYGRLLTEVSGPVMLHWLGAAFDAKLTGYWGAEGIDEAADAMLEVIALAPEKIDGVKVSILDGGREAALRRRMPAGVRVYTGDDFHYDDLIRGDADGHSHALLGAFNPTARVAAAAIRALDAGDRATYDELLVPTVALSRKVFASPTQFYKSGVVFLAYLNGHQEHFRMLGGLEAARSVMHFADLVRLADAAGVLADPELAAERAGHVMASYGVVG